MKILTENTHPLNTPSFTGTDAEKISVLGYWAGMISHLRSMNLIVISHENKLAIIAQLSKELELINIEINNETSHATVHADGSTEMSQVALDHDPMADTQSTPAPTQAVVDLTTNESQFKPKISLKEQMQRLAGNHYKLKK